MTLDGRRVSKCLSKKYQRIEWWLQKYLNKLAIVHWQAQPALFASIGFGLSNWVRYMPVATVLVLVILTAMACWFVAKSLSMRHSTGSAQPTPPCTCLLVLCYAFLCFPCMILQHRAFIQSNFTLGSFIALILRTDFGRKTSSSSSQPPLCHGIAVGFTGRCPRLWADVIADMLSIQALSFAQIGHGWRTMKLPWENCKISNDSKWFEMLEPIC